MASAAAQLTDETEAPVKRRRKRGDARGAILKAAHDCFVRKGMVATSIVDIANAAGYSRPVVYRNFPDKAAIADAVCIERMTILQKEMLPRLHADLPFADQLAEASLVGVLIARSDPFIVRYNEDQASWRRSQRRGEAVREWAKSLWMTFLLRGQAEGHLKRDLDLDTAVTWILLFQSQLIHRYEDEELDEAEMRTMIGYGLAALLR